MYIEEEAVGEVPCRNEALPASLCAGCMPGGSGAGLNRLPMPLTTTPGCMPRKGVSKLIVPSILCRKGSRLAGEYGARRATSVERIPPIL